MPLTVEQFTERLTSSGVMTDEQLRESLASLPAGSASPTDGDQLARELVKRKLLTKFQAEQICAGKEKSLTLGNYVLLDKLGQGGMGMVLKALHRRMERVVALKVISSTAVKSPDAILRFQREAKAAAKLNHPNIVTAHDADEAKGTHFLVMEYVEGIDLRALVKRQGPLPVEQAVRCIIQAACGLEFAHERGVIHRDIKPANLLVDAKGTLKILDMGLARIDGAVGECVDGTELTSTGAILGTVDFMAPEQAMNSKHADARSDIYSLGCSLYYLLTGQVVYDGDTAMKKLMAHQNAPIPSLVHEQRRLGVPPDPDVSAAGRDGVSTYERIDSLFQRMVAKRPEDRPLSMTEVIAELERCVSGDSQSIGSATVSFVRPTSEVSSQASAQDQKDVVGKLPIDTGRRGFNAVVATADSHSTQETDLEFSETSIWPPVAPHPDPQKSSAKIWTTSTKRQRVIVASLLASVILIGLAIRFVPSGVGRGTPNPAAPSEDDPALDKIDFAAERAAAERLMKLKKGIVSLSNGKRTWEMTERLPQEPFYISAVHLAVLDVTDKDLALLVGCRALNELNLRHNPQITAAGLRALGPMPRLESLYVAGTGCARHSLEFLVNYPRLRHFSIAECDSRVGFMQTLPPCPQLNSLDTPNLPGSVGHEGLQAIAGNCPELTRLQLFDGAEYSLAPLSQLSKLKELSCWGCQLDEAAIDSLAGLPNFDFLWVECPDRESLQRLSKLQDKLHEFGMRDQGGKGPPAVTDFSHWRLLTQFAHLEKLTIHETIAVDADSLQAVASMPRLKSFIVQGNLPDEQRGQFRRFTADDVTAFRKARPDVQLTIEGQELSATK